MKYTTNERPTLGQRLRQLILRFSNAFNDSMVNEKKRIHLQYLALYLLLGGVSVFMTVINVITGKTAVLFATAVFSVLCLINFWLSRKSERLQSICSNVFGGEIIILFLYFIISGSPEGFSAFWAIMLPGCGMLLFKRKKATIMCVILLLCLFFLLRTPLGLSLLMHPEYYTESFRLRFPMLFIAFYAVGFLLETIRSVTQQKLEEMTERYHSMYSHDALTKLYNRYGYDEITASTFDNPDFQEVGMLIGDIDKFKTFNDRYGHQTGDMVLRAVAAILTKSTDQLVIRWGGEEFAVLYPNGGLTFEKADKIRKAVENEPLVVDDQELHLTISIGAVTAYASQHPNPYEMSRQADNALYEAKESGRNRTVYKEYVMPKEAD